MVKNVIIYMADWCPWCHKTMDFLTEHKIKFVTRNVEEGRNAEELMKKSGQTSIPVTDMDGRLVLGFDVKKLKELLGIN